MAGNSTATQTSALEPNAISGRGGFEANTSVTDPEGFADVFGQSFINAYFTLTEPTPYSLSGYITRGGIASAAMYLHNASTGFVHQLEPAADQTLTINVSGTLPAGNYLISVNVAGFSQEAPPDLLTHASGEWQMDFTIGGTTDAPVIGGDVSLHVFPNPARDAATVSFANRAGERAAVSVYDLAGRVVRTLETTTATTRWDTRDSAGRPVPAGVYFVRVARGGNVESSAVTVLR